MSKWREWLEEMEQRVKLVKDDAERTRCIEALLLVQERNLPRLIEGYKLMAEAWQAAPALMFKGGRNAGKTYALKKYNAVIEHLRGVGGDP